MQVQVQQLPVLMMTSAQLLLLLLLPLLAPLTVALQLA
jgi:hypothetical protein